MSKTGQPPQAEYLEEVEEANIEAAHYPAFGSSFSETVA